MIKWIGGATAAFALLFGTAAQAAWWLGRNEPAPASTLAQTSPAGRVVTDLIIPVHANMIETDLASHAAPADNDITAREPDAAGIHEARGERLVVKRILPITGPIKYGEWHWDDKDVPPGPIVMTVDLDARVISVFRGGYEIGAAAVLLGTQEHPTPLGTFPVLTKEKDNVSEKYGNAPMPYTLRLTWDGIAIHGSSVENGLASHGCVGTPTPFAAKLFAIAKKGDRVIITRGETIGMGDAIL